MLREIHADLESKRTALIEATTPKVTRGARVIAHKGKLNQQKIARYFETQQSPHGTILVRPRFASGHIDGSTVGQRLGHVVIRDGRAVEYRYSDNRWVYGNASQPYRSPLESCGVVQSGMGRVVVATAPGTRSVYLGREGVIWRHPTLKLDKPAIRISTLPPDTMALWADIVRRTFIDATHPVPVAQVIHEAVQRYHAVVFGYVQETILKATAAGARRTPADYAAFVSRRWGERELLSPIPVTVQHAILTGIVLGLPADRGALLVKLAAIIEYRLPLITDAGASAIYQQAVRLMSQWSPGWSASSYLWGWTEGTIEEVLSAHWTMAMMRAWGREVPVVSVWGPDPDDLLVAVGKLGDLGGPAEDQAEQLDEDDED